MATQTDAVDAADEELTKQKKFRQVVVRRGDLAVRLERHGALGNS